MLLFDPFLSLFRPRIRQHPKMAPLIHSLTPTKFITDALVNSVLEFTTDSWLARLSAVGSDESRLFDLSQLVVERVDHFRLIGGTKSTHGKVAFVFSLLGPTDRFGLQSARDTRAGCIDRTASDLDSRSQLGLFCADSTVKLGARCLAVDRVFINSGYDRLGLEPGTTVEGLPNGGKYHTAQYFIIPRGAPASDRLTVLDCAILASVISDRARDYSSLSYMCCWYATMFFLCAHRICSDRKIAPPIQDKKLKSTGKWGKFTLIDYHTGRLKLPNGASFEDTKQSFERSMTRRQVPPAQIASILATLGADKSHAETETETEAWIMGPDPISVVIELFNARRCQLMLSMKADIARAVAVRTRAAREIAGGSKG
ncbi:hypothetical protein R3P38DRAFT_3053646 [Favolaschia claudopus]|uniref:Uncharacterized protein n=1 Tax=Favolaschia claudopus TaxID=2862362 RepID=A0AAW0A422_9AGAR